VAWENFLSAPALDSLALDSLIVDKHSWTDEHDDHSWNSYDDDLSLSMDMGVLPALGSDDHSLVLDFDMEASDSHEIFSADCLNSVTPSEDFASPLRQLHCQLSIFRTFPTIDLGVGFFAS